MCFTTAATNSNSSVADLKKEVETLKTQMARANSMLAQMYKRSPAMKPGVITQHGICQIMKSSPCGNCDCVEDLSLFQKYFCDCRAIPVERDCKEHYLQGQRVDGLYLVNYNHGNRLAQVFCDQTTDGGGWTVAQRHMDGSENFFRNWTEYKVGFGELHKEHWLGNEPIYLLTSQAFFKGSELRVELQIKGESTMRWAKYSRFGVDSEHTGYALRVTGFSGSSGLDDRLAYHNNMKFSTYDVDNDLRSSGSCSLTYFGAWWYNDCHHSNLNAQYNEFQVYDWTQSFSWYPNLLQFSEMKFRRK